MAVRALLPAPTLATEGDLPGHAHRLRRGPGALVSGVGELRARLTGDGTAIEYELKLFGSAERCRGIHLGQEGRERRSHRLPVLRGRQANLPGLGRERDRGNCAADVIGPAGQGIAAGEFDELVAAMTAGVTYVNVHTADGITPPNTGSGDFPGGEIRGQVE
jgi:hypothetical protein